MIVYPPVILVKAIFGAFLLSLWAAPTNAQVTPALPLGAGTDEATAEQRELGAIVEIYDTDKKLLGTGSVVSFSGLVLTAKHVLEMTTGTLRLAVKIGFRDDKRLFQADLVNAHPLLDLAILKIQSPTTVAWPALPVIINKADLALNLNDEIRLVGHKISGEELYITTIGKVDDPDKSGHIQIGRAVDKGASGGPALISEGNKILGVIVETDFRGKTIVTPVWPAIEYFGIVGVEFAGEGYAKERNTTADLIDRVSAYESLFTDILLDLNTVARLNLNNTIVSTEEQYGELWIGFDRKLRVQPSIDANIILVMSPVVDGFAAERFRFTLSQWIEPPEMSVTFSNIDRELERVLSVENKTLGDVTRVELLLDISPDKRRMVGPVARFETIPGFKICFQMDVVGSATMRQFKGAGVACDDRFSYLEEEMVKFSMPAQ
jgi:hypothetical protein